MAIHDKTPAAKEKNKRRLYILIGLRVFIISVFLAITVFIHVKKEIFEIPQITIYFFYLISAIVYLLSIFYIVLSRLKIGVTKNVILQIVLDILLITGLILNFGNTQIDFSLFYTLVIIYSVFFLGRRGGLVVASVNSILYGVLLDLEFYRIMPFASLLNLKYDVNLSAADVLTNIIVRITSFYILAFLVSFVVEQEKKALLMLEEKESEFSQLDVLFRSIVESVYTGVMTLNMKNVIKTFNRAAEDITGYSRNEVEGKKIEDLFPPLLPFLSESGRENSRVNVKITGKNKTAIHLGVSIAPLKGRRENQIGNILVFQDLTQIKEMEKIIEKNRNLAIIGEMAAGWAHEVRNPLTAITGSIELLNRGLNLDGTNKRLMDIILRSKEQLEGFARDFLLLARPVPPSRERVNINAAAEEALEHIKIGSEWNDNIQIQKSLADGVEAFANKEQVRQIIHNLLLNAVQSMDENGVLSIETATVHLSDGKKYAEIKITDTGCGIEESDLSKVFEPFFTKKTKGTGLGLTIVSHIIEGYKGKIELKSDKGRGTTCWVWLPADEET
ncbi:MAG TPA: ATP-binding protein [Smithella sp.]|nr:ATP-binding protein [Smithella sp.]HRS97342.1 ATP-binding protein [Smithella sp.]